MECEVAAGFERGVFFFERRDAGLYEPHRFVTLNFLPRGIPGAQREASDKEAPMHPIRDLMKIVNPTGSIGIIGVYFDQDPGRSGPRRQKGRVRLTGSGGGSRRYQRGAETRA